MDGRLATLIPQPRSVEPSSGTLSLGGRPSIDAGTGTTAHAAAEGVRRILTEIPWSSHSSQTTITVSVDEARGPEAYRLDITQDGITIVAGATAGAQYAAQTLRQLLPDDAYRAAGRREQAWELPCASIEDAPALSWRGAHIDVARHFATKRELLAIIDALAALKLNRLHLHLTDDQGWRIQSRTYPALHEVGSHRSRSRISLNREEPKVYEDIPHGGYYTLADLAEIAQYAHDRAMTLVPEIDIPGHSSALLAALPELGAGNTPPGGYEVSPDWGILTNLMSPRPEARDALVEIMGEVIDATAARYFHIGGDECVLDAWRADPAIVAYQHERGLATADDLHAAFLRDVADTLADQFGVRAIVWDEGFTSGAIRPDTIVMAWRGMPIARAAAAAGHDVVATPVFPTYYDYYQERAASEPVAIGGPVRIEDVAAFIPVPPDWPADVQAHLIGTQFQVWTEYIPDGRALEYMVFPRACALADVAWSGGPVAWGDGAEDGAPPLRDRVNAHLGRLAAAGLEFRPLTGPAPWQQGGTGPRRHRVGYQVEDVSRNLKRLGAWRPS
jgi:hexosaminidase